MIQSMLGEACARNGNSVKAINAFESLVKVEPYNASFAGHLAKAYLARGWQKRAIEAYKRAILLDTDNISMSLGLSEAYVKNNELYEAKLVLHKAIEKLNGENEEIAIDIYFNLFILDINTGKMTDMKANLEKLTEFASKIESKREHIGWVLFNIAKQMMELQMVIPAKEVLDKAEKLIPEDEELKAIKKDIDATYELTAEFYKLVEEDLGEEFIEFISTKVLPNEAIHVIDSIAEVIKVMCEKVFLENVNIYRKQINLIEDEYPKIYARLKVFLKKAFDKNLRSKMIKDCEKYLNKNKDIVNIFREEQAFDNYEENYDDDEEDYFDEVQMPIVREEPKIGRNDPCPCGSGKKYKKCCG